MKKTWLKFSAFAVAVALMVPVSLLAQKDEKGEKGDKGDKDVQQIIITKKNGKDEKVVVEINGDKITVNGKSLEDYKDQNGDISVRLNKLWPGFPVQELTGILITAMALKFLLTMPTMRCLELLQNEQMGA